MAEQWLKGDDYDQGDPAYGKPSDHAIAGITIGEHGNAVEFYNHSLEVAQQRRDHVLRLIVADDRADDRAAIDVIELFEPNEFEEPKPDLLLAALQWIVANPMAHPGNMVRVARDAIKEYVSADFAHAYTEIRKRIPDRVAKEVISRNSLSDKMDTLDRVGGETDVEFVRRIISTYLALMRTREGKL